MAIGSIDLTANGPCWPLITLHPERILKGDDHELQPICVDAGVSPVVVGMHLMGTETRVLVVLRLDGASIGGQGAVHAALPDVTAFMPVSIVRGCEVVQVSTATIAIPKGLNGMWLRSELVAPPTVFVTTLVDILDLAAGRR